MNPLRFMARAALAVWLLDDAGCSLALATDGEQCSVDTDCTNRGPSFANTGCVANVCQPKAWSCIGKVSPLPSGGMTSIKLQLQDLVSMAPLSSGLTVKLCAKLDPQCQAPLSPAPVLDASGFVTVTVASNFDGYLDITDSTQKYLPALIFLDLAAWAQNSSILLVSVLEETAIASTAKVSLDPTAGLLLVPTVDCTGQRAPGVSVTAAPTATNEQLFYVIAHAPSTIATETDTDGNAGFVNAVAGDVTVTATLGPDGKEMGKVTTIVRAGAMTYQLIRPTPTL